MKIFGAALALVTALATSSAAFAGSADARTPFQLEYIRHIDNVRCPVAYTDALALGKSDGNVDPARAHAATRVFLDCAQLAWVRRAPIDFYTLLAASSELLAAGRETGAAAERSRTNAITLLTPLGGRFFPYFDPTYTNAPERDGAGALVAAVSNVEVFPESDPSPLATIANILVREARAGQPAVAFADAR